MNIIDRYRKEIIVICVIIEIILVPLIVRNIISLNYKNSNDNSSIPSINEIGKQEFGIMYRDNDTDQYKAYSGSIIDAINNRYVLNVGNSKCSDGANSTVTPSSVLSINGSTVTIKSNKTVYCTLYFDKKKTISALDIVASKPKSLSPNADQGDMYRYQGTSDLVNNNYICFGTDNKATCTSDEDHYMYRILGITPSGEMKLIKQTPVVEQGNTIFSWFKATGTSDGGSTMYGTAENGLETWPESAIYKRLNGLSNGSITGDGQKAGKSTNKNINANTNIFVDSYTNEYPYMKRTSEWYGKISSYDWMYGSSTEGFNFDGHEMYKAETGQKETQYRYFDKSTGYYNDGTYTWNPETDKVTAKIGLPYVHDFYLSYYDGSNEDSRGIKTDNSWFSSSISRSHSITSCPYNTDIRVGDGFVESRDVPSDDGRCSIMDTSRYTKGINANPTFYLLNTIEMEGSGLEADPYRIVN